MARLPRLVVAGETHYVIQRAHGAAPAFVDDADRAHYVAVLRGAATAEGVQIHAQALLDAEVQLLATPSTGVALSRLMQAVGRRYVAAYNRRHGRSGTLWDGRFRCGVVEPGAWRLKALCLVDAASDRPSQRTGGPRDALLVDPPEYWQLGNTPFEREAAYRRLLDRGVGAADAAALRQAAVGGWVVGSAGYRAAQAAVVARPLQARPRGRPRSDGER